MKIPYSEHKEYAVDDPLSVAITKGSTLLFTLKDIENTFSPFLIIFQYKRTRSVKARSRYLYYQLYKQFERRKNPSLECQCMAPS